MNKHVTLAAALALICALGAAPAGAEPRETVTTTGPNRELLQSGLFALGVPYVASVIVAATGDRSEDKHLYIPIVGPWLDLANRSPCGHTGEPSCDIETAYKILLIGNGILQGVGALELVGSFFFPETRTVTTGRSEHRLFITPYYVTSGYGVSALTSF